MRPAAIVIGKLAAALAFVVLMIVAAIPITAIVLMYGGASVEDIVRQQVVLLATALVLGAIGLFFSALIKRTQAATVLTYITVLAMILGTTMLFIFWSVVINQNEDGGFDVGPTERAPEQLMYINPMVGMLDVVANTEPGGFGGINQMLAQLRGETRRTSVATSCARATCASRSTSSATPSTTSSRPARATGGREWRSPRSSSPRSSRSPPRASWCRPACAGHSGGPGRRAGRPVGPRPIPPSREHPIIQELREEPEPER